MAEHLLGRVVIFLIIQPVNASEIGYSALRRDARSAEKYERMGLRYYLRKFVFHLYHSVSVEYNYTIFRTKSKYFLQIRLGKSTVFL